MTHRSRTAIAVLLLSTAHCFAADPLPRPWPDDCSVNSWTNFNIEWKASWDETLATNFNGKALREAATNVAERVGLRPGAGTEEQILRMRHIALLEAMIQHFPQNKEQHLQAYSDIAGEYVNLGDRARTIQWNRKLIEDFPGRNSQAASACYEILRYSHPFDCIPDAGAWVTFASAKALEIEKTDASALNSLTLDLARRHPCMLLNSEGRYIETRRFLDGLKDKSGSDFWWLLEQATLMEKAGAMTQAADLYRTAGNRAMADNILARIGRSPAEDAVSRPPQELELRWKALQERILAPGTNSLMEPVDAQEVLKLSAESWAMNAASPTTRSQFWMGVDNVLRGAKPADLQRLRELQNKNASALATELKLNGDPDEIIRLFRRYPWSKSVHELMVEAGENALMNGHKNWAVRSFKDVVAHTADAELMAEAQVGLWLAISQGDNALRDLDAAMAAIPDSMPLPWHGEKIPASEVKKCIRESVQPDMKAPSDLATVKRRRLDLPQELANDNPGSHSSMLVPWGVGPWAINRIEHAGDLLTVIGPRTVACYDTNANGPRWFNAAPRQFYRDADSPDAEHERQMQRGPLSRPLTIGSSRSPATAAYRGTHSAGTASSRAVFMLVSSPSGNERVTYHIAAFDADNGRALWSTRESLDWQDLEPMNAPTASDGRVYAIACGPEARKYRATYLVCMNDEDGAIVWKRRIGSTPLADNSHELAMAGSAITLHQGSLYISTDRGITARLDVRDGMADWISTYANSASGEMMNQKFRREGTSPLVTGDKVLMAPRDCSGALALDRDSGKIAWETPLVPSDQIIGVAGNAAILTSGREMSALDMGSGIELWHRILDESSDVQAVLAGSEIVAVCGSKLLRINPATGAESSAIPLERTAGTETVLLRDVSLAEIGEEKVTVPGEIPAAASAIHDLPLHQSWHLFCENPELTWPMPGNGPSDIFCILSGRSILCVKTRPGFELVWQRRLRNRPDSVGFHGSLVLALHGRDLSALNVVDGATKWSTDLPFAANIICGNDQVILAGHASTEGKVVALDSATGRIMWSRWFGQEIRFNGAKLNWLALQKDNAGRSMLHLYWGRPALEKGSGLSEAIVDPKSGLVSEVRPFLPTEPDWPSFIAFGDNVRGPGNAVGVAPWSRQGPFLPDAVAYVGKDSLAHLLARTPAADLAPGWMQVMDVKPESQYLETVSLHPTSAGPFIRRVGELSWFDTSTSTGIVYALPRNIPMRTAFNILDFTGDTGTVVVVSGARNAPVDEGDYPYLWNGLQDCTGRGDVSLKCFNGQVQLGHSTRGLHEAGSNPVATLLNGAVKQHYMNSLITMSGISSLGWSKYTVLFYGFTGTASIDGGQEQKCAGADYSKEVNRTTFIPGTNYLKFADLSGDTFTLNFSQCDFTAVEIVNASPNAAKDKPEAIGINWTGGGPGLGSSDLVGAEVPHGNWYNINQFNILHGGPSNTAHGLPGVCVDVFKTGTGELLKTGSLPGSVGKATSARYKNKAKIIDNAIITTDSKGIRVYRSGASAN